MILSSAPRTQSLAGSAWLGNGLDSSQGSRSRVQHQRPAVAKLTVQGENCGGENGLPMLE